MPATASIRALNSEESDDTRGDYFTASNTWALAALLMDPADSAGTSSCAVPRRAVRAPRCGWVFRSGDTAGPIVGRRRSVDRAADHRWLIARVASGLPEAAADHARQCVAGCELVRPAYADERPGGRATPRDRRCRDQPGSAGPARPHRSALGLSGDPLHCLVEVPVGSEQVGPEMPDDGVLRRSRN